MSIFDTEGCSGIDVKVLGTENAVKFVLVNACTNEVQNCRHIAESHREREDSVSSVAQSPGDPDTGKLGSPCRLTGMNNSTGGSADATGRNVPVHLLARPSNMEQGERAPEPEPASIRVGNCAVRGGQTTPVVPNNLHFSVLVCVFRALFAISLGQLHLRRRSLPLVFVALVSASFIWPHVTYIHRFWCECVMCLASPVDPSDVATFAIGLRTLATHICKIFSSRVDLPSL